VAPNGAISTGSGKRPSVATNFDASAITTIVADADATIHGKITAFQILPLTYNSQTGQSASYLVTITATVHVNDRNGRLLYENSHYTFRQQYQTTTDLTTFIEEDPAAVARLSRDFAQALVSDLLDSF